MRPGFLGDLSDTWFGDFAGRGKRKSTRRAAPASIAKEVPHARRAVKGRPGFAKGRRERPGASRAPARGAALRSRAQQDAARSGSGGAGGAGGSQFLTGPQYRGHTCGSHPLVVNSPRRAELLTLCSQCVGPHNPGGSVYNIVGGRNNNPEIVCLVNKGSYHQPTRMRLPMTAVDQAASDTLRVKAAASCNKFAGPWRFGMSACKQCIAKGGIPTPYGTPATTTRAGSTMVYCDIPGQGRQVISSAGIIQRGSRPGLGPGRLTAT